MPYMLVRGAHAGHAGQGGACQTCWSGGHMPDMLVRGAHAGHAGQGYTFPAGDADLQASMRNIDSIRRGRVGGTHHATASVQDIKL